MSRTIRSDYRGVTKCIAKVVSINFTIEPKFSRQKIAFITEEIAWHLKNWAEVVTYVGIISCDFGGPINFVKK